LIFCFLNGDFLRIYKSKFCEIILVGNEGGIKNIYLNTGKKEIEISSDWIKTSEFFNGVKKQLSEYFEGKRQIFDSCKF